MKLIGTIMIIGYFGILERLIPGRKRSFDVLKIHIRFLPPLAKIAGLLWIVFIFIYSAITSDLNPGTNIILLVGINFGLAIIVFSKEKKEDEFSSQIRLKAMFISIVSFFLLLGVFACFKVISPNSISKDSFVAIMMLSDATLVVYLIYFYFTKYRFGLKKTD